MHVLPAIVVSASLTVGIVNHLAAMPAAGHLRTSAATSTLVHLHPVGHSGVRGTVRLTAIGARTKAMCNNIAIS